MSEYFSIDINENECNICYEEITSNVTFYCDHYICLNCYNKMIINEYFNCPFCREEVKEMKKLLKYIKKLRPNITVENNYIKICKILSFVVCFICFLLLINNY